jgi:hypothetical protein
MSHNKNPRWIPGVFSLRFDQFFEHRRIVAGDLGEDLAVERNLFAFERSHEFGEARSEFADRRVDADLVQGAIVALLEFAVAVGVYACLGHRRFGEGNFGLAAPHHALRPFEDVLAALDVMHAAFDTCHMGERRGRLSYEA